MAPKKFETRIPAPQAGESPKFKLSDHVGRTLSITVQSVETMNTKFGEKDAIKADVTIVDGLLAGMDFGDVLLFQAAVVDALRDSAGDEDPIVAQVIETTSKTGNVYLGLAAPSDDMWEAAQKLYIPAQPETLPY